MGLISDKIWLRDTECLRLKYECRIAESNFKLFIKLHSKEVKQIQKLQHEQRRMKYIK